MDETTEETPQEYAWMLDARCRGVSPTEFFPSDGLGVEAAQRVCAGCAVRTECLEYALVHRIEHGVWGGASERERRRILRRRRGLMPAPASETASPGPVATAPVSTAPTTEAVTP